jgi:endonuclease YncB( thermonuclease family)
MKKAHDRFELNALSRRGSACLVAALAAFALLVWSAPGLAQDDRVQTRPSLQRIEVPVEKIEVGDGDTVTILWNEQDHERVRILGIDTPETQNIQHNLPYSQPFGHEATAFAKGAFAFATKVELARAETTDGYGRTLGYFYINGRNYSEMIILARLAVETVNHYGDNGFPEEAELIKKAALAAGPAPFEEPYKYRRRMREVTDWLRATRQID